MRHFSETLVVVASLVWPACAGLKVPARNDLAGQKVVAVELIGNHRVPDRDVIRVLAHRPPAGIYGPNGSFYESTDTTRYDPATLRLDKRRVGAFYRTRGYFRGRATDVKVDAVPGGVRVRFKVFEGKRTRIERVRRAGVPPNLRRPVTDLLRDLGLARGQGFVHETYLDAKEKLLALLQESGYAHAKTSGEVQIDRDTHRADVRLIADAGPKVRFGPSKIDTRDTEVPRRSIAARVSWDEGELWHPKKVQDTTRHLRELGFASVRVGFNRTGRRPAPPTLIKVNDGKRHELKAGFGVARTGDRLEGRVLSDYAQKRFLHPLMIFRARGELGRVFRPTTAKQFTYETSASVTRLDIFAPLLSGSVAGGIQVFPFEAFRSFDTHIGLVLERPFLARRLRLEAGWEVHRIELSPRDGVQNINDTIQRLAFFEQAVTLDLRDDRLNPRRGGFFELKFEEGGAFSASEVQYIRGELDVRGYAPLGGRLVLAGRASVGLMAENEESEEPLTRRFYAGGSSSHRGFAIRRLSPFTEQLQDGRRVSQPPVGGKALALGNLELRYRLTEGDFALAIASFLDVGDVTPTREELDLSNLHYAAGGGVRLQTPFGPIRVDLAWRLNRLAEMEADGTPNPSPRDRFVFHVTIGEAF